MKKDWIFIFGSVLLVLGIVFLVNSFSGLTGFVIIDELDGLDSSVIAIVFIGGCIAVLSYGVRERARYDRTAAQIYRSLAQKDAFGHHTHGIAVVEGWVARGDVSKRYAGRVIEGELDSGRLKLDKTRTSISINRDPEKLEEVIHKYGGWMQPALKERIEKHKKGKVPSGSR